MAASVVLGSGDQMMFSPRLRRMSRMMVLGSLHIANRRTHRRGSVRPASGVIENGARGNRSGDIGRPDPGLIFGRKIGCQLLNVEAFQSSKDKTSTTVCPAIYGVFRSACSRR